MGASLINFYRNKVKWQWKVALATTVIVGLLIHIYKFTNTLPNHDSLFNFYSSQNMVKSGRWFLSISCSFSSFFDLPWVIGLLSILMIGLTSVVIVEIFKMENSVLIIISSALLVSFPAITETFYFEFTADGYMLAMLLAAFSVYCSTLKQHGRRWMIVSAVCICLTCGIYQAYVSFALVLAVCYFMYELLEGENMIREYIVWIAKQTGIYCSGLMSYLVIWKMCMLFQGYTATTYEGISTLGQVNIHTINGAIYQSIRSFIMFFVEWNFFKHGLTWYTGLNLAFLLSAAFVMIFSIKSSGIFKRGFQLILLLISGIAIPFCIFLWYFASPGVSYATRMEQSICICFIFIAVLSERWLKPGKSTIVAVVLFAIVWNNGITANKFYYYMNLCYERSYATAVEMQTRIHLADDGTATSVAWLGNLESFSDEFYTDMDGFGSLGVLKNINRTLMSFQTYSMLFMSQFTDFELEYYRTHPEAKVSEISYIGTGDPVPNEWSVAFPVVDNETLALIKASDEVANMGIWPASNSVQLIGDTIVIKLSELKEG